MGEPSYLWHIPCDDIENAQLLRLAVEQDLEVSGRKIGDMVAMRIRDHRIHLNQINGTLTFRSGVSVGGSHGAATGQIAKTAAASPQDNGTPDPRNIGILVEYTLPLPRLV